MATQKKGAQPVKKETKKQPEKKDNAKYLTEDELKELRETFDLFDDDKSGTIDAHEIKKVLEDLGLDSRNPVVYAMVQDLENYGQAITFETFVNIIMERLGNNKTKDGAEKLFNLYDDDGTGSINFDKVKKIAKELGETMNDEELEEMMHHIHVLKKTEVPNEINFDEFYEIITAPRRY